MPLVDNDGSGSGCLTKFTFLLLVTLLVAGAGIAFYEVDVLDIKEQILGLVGVEPIDAESPIIDILAEDAEPAFTGIFFLPSKSNLVQIFEKSNIIFSS